MPVGLKAPNNLLPINGVRFSSINAGIYQQKDRDDLALIELVEGSQAAGVFTKNVFCAAPVVIAKSHLDITSPKYLLINAGNANAGTGQQGIKDVIACCETLSNISQVQISKIIPFSTGVIGEKLPVKNIQDKLPELLHGLSDDSVIAVANAIKTTDTLAKGISKQIIINGETITITGIAKGSGMIKPDMATMLSYIFTDAKLEKDLLQKILINCTEKSFHRITVDGDTSTNDACLLIATGNSTIEVLEKNETDYSVFLKALEEVFIYLAQSIVRDGEGATKFVTIRVDNGSSESECSLTGDKIAHSPFVKTALFASDPNWGRILAAIGRSGIHELDISNVDIYLDDMPIIKQGEVDGNYSEERGKQVMEKDEIMIRINLNRGDNSMDIWTSDLSYEYVKINAEYRT